MALQCLTATLFVTLCVSSLANPILSSMANSLFKIQNFNLVVITDFKSNQAQFLIDINQYEQDLTIVNVNNIAGFYHKRDCQDIYKDTSNRQVQSTLFLLWLQDVSSVNQTINTLANTIHICPTEIEPGVFHMNNIILVYNFERSLALEQVVFQLPIAKQHRNFGIVTGLNSSALIVRAFDIYQDKTRPTLIFEQDQRIKNLDELFPSFSMEGYSIRFTTNPYAYNVVADEKTNPKSDRDMYENHAGYEIEMIKAISEVHGFEIEFSNAADFAWGTIVDGEWNGLIGHLWRSQADIITTILPNTKRIKVCIYRWRVVIREEKPLRKKILSR